MLLQRMEAFIPNVVLLEAQVTLNPFEEAAAAGRRPTCAPWRGRPRRDPGHRLDAIGRRRHRLGHGVELASGAGHGAPPPTHATGTVGAAFSCLDRHARRERKASGV